MDADESIVYISLASFIGISVQKPMAMTIACHCSGDVAPACVLRRSEAEFQRIYSVSFMPA